MLELDSGSTCPQPQVDPQVAVLAPRPQRQAIASDSAEQESFGQVRPLVRHFWFAADEQDLALEACIAQARGRGVPGGTAADDYCLRDSSRTRRSDQAR